MGGLNETKSGLHNKPELFSDLEESLKAKTSITDGVHMEPEGATLFLKSISSNQDLTILGYALYFSALKLTKAYLYLVFNIFKGQK